MTDVLNKESYFIQKPWREVPAAGIYCVDVSNSSVATRDNILHDIVCYPWLKPCTREPSERKVVVAADDATLCDAASALEQAWGGVTVRRSKLGVVAPLGIFNTALPCGIGITPKSTGQSVDDAGTGSCANRLESRLGEECVIGDEITGSCILTSQETHARSTSHDVHGPVVSCGTRAPSMTQTAMTSCINTDRHDTTVAPSVSSSAGYLTTNPTEGAASSLMKWATQRQWELSEKLLNFLSEAVRLRVQLQASRCHRCLTQELCKGREGGDRPNGLSFVDAPVASCAVSSDTSVSTHGDDSRANSFAVPGDGDNHGNIDDYPIDDTTEDPTLHRTSFAHRPALPGETPDTRTHQSRCLDANRPDVQCRHARVSVLFSGGIDSLVIAALADR